MPVVTEEEARAFVERYLALFQGLESQFSQENLRYFFPRFLRVPFRIKITISDLDGVAIEFLEQSQSQRIEVERRHIRIQDAVLPRTFADGMPMFKVANAGNLLISNLTLSIGYKQQFYTLGQEGRVEFLNVRFEVRHPDKPLAKRSQT